jgi:predicted amidohydrolase
MISGLDRHLLPWLKAIAAGSNCIVVLATFLPNSQGGHWVTYYNCQFVIDFLFLQVFLFKGLYPRKVPIALEI